jgi:hypothetical protein
MATRGVYQVMTCFMRLRASLALVTLVAVLLAGCATTESRNRATVLSLPYEQFDQTFGSGWRPVFDQREYAKAAILIEDYLRSRHELTPGQQKFLHMHAGMLFALAGKNTRAVKHLDQAATDRKLPELWPDWNDFVAATRAFLTHDRPAIEAARERLAAANSSHLVMADRLVQTFGSSYAEWWWWARVCSKVVIPKDATPELRSAAMKLAKAFDCSISVAEDGPQPSCIWVELRDFAPKSFAMGYVIIHSPDGTHITASNQYWLDAAVQRFIKSSRVSNGHIEAPFGLTTSFNLAR